MMNKDENKHKILITDDSEMNRELLAEMLRGEFEIWEAKDGEEAVSVLQNHAPEISLVLLDIVMPKMDGFEVLAFMNKYRWIEEVPVIMISSESSSTYIERAYELGVSDYISRPFDAVVVHRRVVNTIMLYAKQKKLMGLVADQIYEKEKSNSLMVSILSHIVEFRNGESGLHVLHINALTELLLQRLVQKTDRYHLSRADISLISMASALHDIGKILVPDEILNKPGRLTAEEFEIMKKHSIAGADMLKKLPMYQNEPLVKVAYEICRWHHERYDGNGYPDGLAGEDIPISAQIVSLADVYDALTSERCYKKAFPHEVAMQMILNGQCGAFHPLLLECLSESADVILKEFEVTSLSVYNKKEIQSMTEELLRSKELPASEHTWNLLECERIKNQFLVSTSDAIIFSYSSTANTLPVLTLSPRGAELFRTEEYLMEPCQNRQFLSVFGEENLNLFKERVSEATQKEPDFHIRCQLTVDKEPRWYDFQCCAIWMEGKEKAQGVIGRITDINRAYGLAEKQEKLRSAAFSVPELSGFSREFRECVVEDGELSSLMTHLKMIFDIVRLVDAATTTQYVIDDDGKFEELPYRCYAVWKKRARCENCISAKVVQKRERLEKFEFVGEDIYYVIAILVKVNDLPYSLEMVAKITDETLIGGTGKGKLIETISNHNKRLYFDPVTGAYNRRYFEEQLRGLGDRYAVTMIDIDNFKKINDSYGHHAGDLALQAIAKEILSCIRETDAAVRYGGDEFLIVFGQITQEAFRVRMEQIRNNVKKIRIGEYPDIRLSISLGGVYRNGLVKDLAKEADKLLYQAKVRRDSVQLNEE